MLPIRPQHQGIYFEFTVVQSYHKAASDKRAVTDGGSLFCRSEVKIPMNIGYSFDKKKERKARCRRQARDVSWRHEPK